MADDLSFTRLPFDFGTSIPVVYTCDGASVSPPLSWEGVPEQAVTLALIVDDPDAPGQTFTHWVWYNVSAETTDLPRDVDFDQQFGDADPRPVEGENGFEGIGYGAPCPPHGAAPHRYFFRLYALDTALPLRAGASRQGLLDAMQGHILAETELMGTYGRGR